MVHCGAKLLLFFGAVTWQAWIVRQVCTVDSKSTRVSQNATPFLWNNIVTNFYSIMNTPNVVKHDVSLKLPKHDIWLWWPWQVTGVLYIPPVTLHFSWGVCIIDLSPVIILFLWSGLTLNLSLSRVSSLSVTACFTYPSMLNGSFSKVAFCGVEYNFFL